MARSLGHIKNWQQAFSIDSNSSSMCLTVGYWSQPFPVESKCFAILDEGSRTLACMMRVVQLSSYSNFHTEGSYGDLRLMVFRQPIGR
jgi:hypothetical protein